MLIKIHSNEYALSLNVLNFDLQNDLNLTLKAWIHYHPIHQTKYAD